MGGTAHAFSAHGAGRNLSGSLCLLKGHHAGQKKELRTIELSDLGVDLSSAPQVEVLRVYFPEAGKKAEILKGSTEMVVAQLVEKLKKEAKVL